jgi:hypothetical protein
MREHDIESESLPAHVSICQERYNALEAKFQSVDEKITKINLVLEDIRTDLLALGQSQNNRWNSMQISVIGMLMTVIGALGARLYL